MGRAAGWWRYALVLTALGLGLGALSYSVEGPLGMVLFALNGCFVSILISRLMHATHARKESDDRFQLMFDASPLPTLIVRETDNIVVDVNAAFLETFAWTRAEMTRRPARAVNLYPDARQRRKLFELWRSHGTIRNVEMDGKRKTGESRTLLVSVDRVMIGGVPHAQTVINDITEQRAYEKRFENLFHVNPSPSTIMRERDQRWLTVNDAFIRMLGYSGDEICGKTFAEMPLLADTSHRADGVRKYLDRGHLRDFEAVFVTKYGAHIDVLFSVERVEFEGESALLAVYKDITARKQTDAALRESEARFRALAENIDEVFWVSQPDGACVYASPAFERVWGRTCRELQDEPRLWLDAVHPEDRESIRIAVPAARDDYAREYRIYRPDGTLRWIRNRGSAVRDERGQIIRYVGIAEDITEQHALEDQLRQAQKLESLGLLAGGVAHDFNNVLAVISACSGMLCDEIPKESSQRELVDDITHAVDRASALTRQLLAFSRRQVTEPRVIDLNLIVNETRKMLRRMVGEDIILTTSLEPELGHVRADPGYIVQVLMNLAVNARDAMPRGGSLSLSTRNVILAADATRRHPTAKAGPAVELTVRDNGSGIPMEIQHRIFEPFFTTKGVGRGTGMGLAVVHGIVDQAGGFIEVDSQPSVGTIFRIFLPTVNENIDELRDIAPAMALGVESVLLVDDDEHVRRVAARALRTRGYTVIEAGDGRAALAVLDSLERVDLLLTDVVMPGIDGRQLAELACTKQPQLKVLYTSGYTDDAVVRHGVMQGAVDLIEKPFRIDSLAMRVRQSLDRDPAISAVSSAASADRIRVPVMD
jgi:PAS domain S-box-containing protein